MAGIQFHRTTKLEALRDFYQQLIGMEVWLEQDDCAILKHENFLLGFCEGVESDTSGIITFFYREKERVDEMYRKLADRATSEPEANDKYNIYHFLARDPEERAVEFQCFLHPTEAFADGQGMLSTRRSIRSFTDEPVTDDLLWKIVESCRYSPTSRNSQAYYFHVIREKKTIEWLAARRIPNSGPIGRAGTAVAIVSDPSSSRRHIQDACIAAYHFFLAAWLYGLGTCWIAAMDREDVKNELGIPQDHYIATVTPLGYAAEQPRTPGRRPRDAMVKFHK